MTSPSKSEGQENSITGLPDNSCIALHLQIGASKLVVETISNSVERRGAVDSVAVLIKAHFFVQCELIFVVGFAFDVHHALERYHMQLLIWPGHQWHFPRLNTASSVQTQVQTLITSSILRLLHYREQCQPQRPQIDGTNYMRHHLQALCALRLGEQQLESTRHT
jgi:hypothetical protein